MKKLIPFLMAAILFSGCRIEKPAETTVLDLFTPYNFFPETLKGKVKELTELNFWAVEQDGKIIAGNPVTLKDRDSLINWTNDFRIQFNESGEASIVEYLDENGKVFGKYEVTSENGKYLSANWFYQDTLNAYAKFHYDDSRLIKAERFSAETDSLTGGMTIEYGEKGRSAIQQFNSKGEPVTKFAFTLDEKGLLTGYSWSLKDTVRGGMNFIYNEMGSTSEQEVYDKTKGTSESYKYDYEYDKTGNPIKYIAFKDGKPEVVCKRILTYYQ